MILVVATREATDLKLRDAAVSVLIGFALAAVFRALLGVPVRRVQRPVLMPTYRIDLAYDGTGFRGYARQDGQRTIQGELESALETVLGVSLPTIGGWKDRCRGPRQGPGRLIRRTSGDIDGPRLARSSERHPGSRDRSLGDHPRRTTASTPDSRRPIGATAT